MLYSIEYQIMKYFSIMLRQNKMKIREKLNDFVYFLYPFINLFFFIICSNKYVKQVVLTNHSLISPMLQRGWG